ncbi:UNVERIFIED_CONTAM: hypothetical protein K2H54_029244 [Gekko kuhli]
MQARALRKEQYEAHRLSDASVLKKAEDPHSMSSAYSVTGYLTDSPFPAAGDSREEGSQKPQRSPREAVAYYLGARRVGLWYCTEML